jgi:hypothetical protein
MSNVYVLTENAIATLGIDYAADAERDDVAESLPDEFIVYKEVTATPLQSADDAETEREYVMQVSYFSRGGLVGLPDVEGAMLAQGFRFTGDVPLEYDTETGHYGLAKEFSILINQ